MDYSTIIHLCPDCGARLELYANGDNGPQDDRWSCAPCGIEYPHHLFPLPPGYVKEAKDWERAQAREDRQIEERARLKAWNAWAQSPEQ